MSIEHTAVPVDFDDLADWLLLINSMFSPAELHGAIVGGLCGAMRLSRREWAAFGLAVMGADERTSAEQREHAQQVIGGLAQEQLDLLSGNDMTFNPFLPDDDVDVDQRTEALGSWCKGFLGGFAEAQVYCQRQRAENDLSDISDNVREALQDISAIAQASVDAKDYDEGSEAAFDEFEEEFGLPSQQDDSGLVTEEDEEYSERDYMEIVEYLRLAALTVFTEYGWIEVYGADTGGSEAGSGKGKALESNGKNTLH